MTPSYLYLPEFIDDTSSLFSELKAKIQWDRRMASRNTASFGVPYNYSQISYPSASIPDWLLPVLTQVAEVIGWMPNNALLNYYEDGSHSMGFHSDDVMFLTPNTGVAIVSVGSPRLMRFRNIKNSDIRTDLILAPGSLLHLSNELQQMWQHAIPKQTDVGARISITLRRIQIERHHPHPPG